MNYIKYLGGCFIVMAILISGCSKFLELKPDQKMTVPTSLEDCDALLDDRYTMNTLFPMAGELGSDNYYLTTESWQALLFPADRDGYIWDPKTDLNFVNWQGAYKVNQIANQVLEILDKLPAHAEANRYNRIKGSAYFFRAYAFSQLTDVFALPYREQSATTDLGIPLRLSPNVDFKSVRATMKQTYSQIISDLQAAITLLPVETVFKTRPSKAAAYAALSRVALVVHDYKLAEEAALEALEIYNQLLDYNLLNKNATVPFVQFNKEVIFDASTVTSANLYPINSKIDQTLYTSYHESDLRKVLYFSKNTDGSVAFKGKYDGQINAAAFAGIALDEVYLSLAEAYANNGKTVEAMQTLNVLMESRWVKNEYVPFVANTKVEALTIILSERRKSLVMRNLRWMDIKRLNQYPLFKTTIIREIQGKTYELKPDDLRFAFLIPLKVMTQSTSIKQNLR